MRFACFASRSCPRAALALFVHSYRDVDRASGRTYRWPMSSRPLRSLTRSRTRPLGPVVVLGCLVSLGCTEAADIPDVPDLETLRQEYNAPTAGLDGADVRRVLDTFPALERLARALRAADPLIDSVHDARDAANERSGRGVDLRGALTIDLNCPGQEARPSFDEVSNGNLSIDLAVERGVIKQAFWMTARRCLLRAALGSLAFPVELDGPIAIDLGAPIGLRQAWQRDRTLVSLLGTISIDALTLSDVSARYGPRDFEYLQRTEGGSVVLFVSEDGIGLRDRDATWLCERGDGVCGAR